VTALIGEVDGSRGRPAAGSAIPFPTMPDAAARRLRRLAEELAESGLRLNGTEVLRGILLEEIDNALRPAVHEGKVASHGTIFEPKSDPSTWSALTQLEITRGPIGEHPLSAARRFADGRSSWIVRRADETNEWLVLDRPAGSERDLVVLAGILDATIVQRHLTGTVRVVGHFGVMRWQGLTWRHEPPVSSWINAVVASPDHGKPEILEAMLEFAVHDLGSRGIGSLLVYRPDTGSSPAVEERLPTPPPLRIDVVSHLAPLRHALSQIDGAAVFDVDGVLHHLGVRLVPSNAAEQTVDAIRGTRHTSGRRYSHDDPLATIIVVSEDGPVTVLRNGAVLGHSHNGDEL
jgi:hypothetical protein